LLTETLSVGSGTPLGSQLAASNQLLELPPTHTLSAENKECDVMSNAQKKTINLLITSPNILVNSPRECQSISGGPWNQSSDLRQALSFAFPPR
jgi:hypothetical protein